MSMVLSSIFFQSTRACHAGASAPAPSVPVCVMGQAHEPRRSIVDEPNGVRSESEQAGWVGYLYLCGAAADAYA